MLVGVIGFAAGAWAFAEEVSVQAICVAVTISVSAEEVSVKVTQLCVCRGGVCANDLFRRRVFWCSQRVCDSDLRLAAVFLVFAEEVSTRVICIAVVMLPFAEEVCSTGVFPFFLFQETG